MADTHSAALWQVHQQLTGGVQGLLTITGPPRCRFRNMAAHLIQHRVCHGPRVYPTQGKGNRMAV